MSNPFVGTFLTFHFPFNSGGFINPQHSSWLCLANVLSPLEELQCLHPTTKALELCGLQRLPSACGGCHCPHMLAISCAFRFWVYLIRSGSVWHDLTIAVSLVYKFINHLGSYLLSSTPNPVTLSVGTSSLFECRRSWQCFQWGAQSFPLQFLNITGTHSWIIHGDSKHVCSNSISSAISFECLSVFYIQVFPPWRSFSSRFNKPW